MKAFTNLNDDTILHIVNFYDLRSREEIFFLNNNDNPKPRKRNDIDITIDSSPHSEATYKLGAANKYIKP